MTDNTLLAFAQFDIPPYSARGISQTLEPIRAASSMRRTVNGDLVDLSAAALRKYQSTITCTDMDHPVLDDLWPGDVLTVDCIVELKHRDTTDASPARTAVPGSTRTEGGYVYYRPRLTMMVVNYRVDHDEWGAETGWTLDLEEQ